MNSKPTHLGVLRLYSTHGLINTISQGWIVC